MNDGASFILSVATLLIVPGPTNTLLAAGGASAGLRRSLMLVPAECCGYLLSILSLILVVGPLVGNAPAFGLCLRIAACLYLLWSAIGLWRGAAQPDRARPIGPVRIFFTTLLNPKALIFALVIFPQGLPVGALLPFVLVFVVLVCSVAVCWIAFGAGMARSAPRFFTVQRTGRLAAVALAVFATVLGGSALAAIIG